MMHASIVYITATAHSPHIKNEHSHSPSPKPDVNWQQLGGGSFIAAAREESESAGGGGRCVLSLLVACT